MLDLVTDLAVTLGYAAAGIVLMGIGAVLVDLAQDAGFAASTIPLGLSLTRKVEGA